jgi:hypothetical protein
MQEILRCFIWVPAVVKNSHKIGNNGKDKCLTTKKGGSPIFPSSSSHAVLPALGFYDSERVALLYNP